MEATESHFSSCIRGRGSLRDESDFCRGKRPSMALVIALENLLTGH